MKPDFDRWIREQGREAFSRLLRSSAYSSEVSAGVKRQMTMEVWRRDVTALKDRYDAAGLKGDEVGFGFLVEAFVRQSAKIPRNTETAQHLAGILLGELSSGGTFTRQGKSLSNPDHLFINMTGLRAEIWGIGEIKASVEAYHHKPDQIHFFERNLRRVVDAIEAGKSNHTIHKFLAKRKIVVSPNLQKSMIVPGGSGDAMKRALPENWEVTEIEFTYNELVFLAQQIWPRFRRNQQFELNYLGLFEKDFLGPLVKWFEMRLGEVFQGHPEFPARELVLFAASTGKLPLLPEDVAWVKEAINAEEIASIWESGSNDWSHAKHKTSRWENQFMQRFRSGMNLDKSFSWFFLGKLRRQTEALASVLWSHESKVSAMTDFDLLAL